jgi:hypothetical protein
MLRTLLTAAIVAALVPIAASHAEKPDKPVVIEGPLPLPVDVGERLPPLHLAPDQQVEVESQSYLPGEIIVLQAFTSSNSGPEVTTAPIDMVLRAITISPSNADTNPDLLNCKALIRWPAEPNPLHPASTDRLLLSHAWEGDNQVTLNHTLAFPILLPQGTRLETLVFSIPTISGFCEGVATFTGTTLQ